MMETGPVGNAHFFLPFMVGSELHSWSTQLHHANFSDITCTLDSISSGFVNTCISAKLKRKKNDSQQV